jgi:hypothetical protein
MRERSPQFSTRTRAGRARDEKGIIQTDTLVWHPARAGPGKQAFVLPEIGELKLASARAAQATGASPQNWGAVKASPDEMEIVKTTPSRYHVR